MQSKDELGCGVSATNSSSGHVLKANGQVQTTLSLT